MDYHFHITASGYCLVVKSARPKQYPDPCPFLYLTKSDVSLHLLVRCSITSGLHAPLDTLLYISLPGHESHDCRSWSPPVSFHIPVTLVHRDDEASLHRLG